MQQELDAADLDLDVQIIGVNENGQQSGNPLMVDGRELPLVQDTDTDANGDSDVWESWDITFRDVVIVDENNVVVGVFNVTDQDLALPQNYNALRQMFIDAAGESTDPPPDAVAFSSSTFSVSETGATATITVTRTDPTQASVTVNYASSNGTATAGADYQPAAGTLTFGPGESTKTFQIAILDDNRTSEGSESVSLVLSGPTGGASLFSPTTAVLAISDNEQQFAAADDQFLAQAYQDILGRGVEQIGLDYWRSQLAAGRGRELVALGIVTSVEARGRAADAMYAQYLGRSPSGEQRAEIVELLSFLDERSTREEAAASLIGGDEYSLLNASSDPADFLDALYQDALGRSIDQATASSLAGRLEDGASRQAVALDVLFGEAYRREMVSDFFQQFLGRPAEASAQASLAGLLADGARDEQIIAMILASPEYLARI